MECLWWLSISGTVIPTIWWKVAFFVIYSGAVVCVENFVPILYKAFPTHLIAIIGTVIGLLLVFRTNSAYSRYWEGRELWSKVAQDVRKCTRAIWSGVKEAEAKDLVEKKSALNLCSAFVVATKHYIRGEYARDYEDFEGLLDNIPQPFSPPVKEDHEEKGPERKAFDLSTPTNIPIELSYYLVSYVKYLEDNELIYRWAVVDLQESISSLVDCLSGFERLLRTPLPLAYAVHLQECVWLFLLAIPFQTIGDVGPWFTIPIVGIAAFVYLGILEISAKIQNPFGYKSNDFPLDDYCSVIRLEIQKVLVSDTPVAHAWLYSSDNRPFGPMCSLTAAQLAELPYEEAKGILKSVSQSAIISTEVDNTIKRRAESIPSSLHLRSGAKGYQSI